MKALLHGEVGVFNDTSFVERNSAAQHPVAMNIARMNGIQYFVANVT